MTVQYEPGNGMYVSFYATFEGLTIRLSDEWSVWSIQQHLKHLSELLETQKRLVDWTSGASAN